MNEKEKREKILKLIEERRKNLKTKDSNNDSDYKSNEGDASLESIKDKEAELKAKKLKNEKLKKLNAEKAEKLRLKQEEEQKALQQKEADNIKSKFLDKMKKSSTGGIGGILANKPSKDTDTNKEDFEKQSTQEAISKLVRKKEDVKKKTYGDKIRRGRKDCLFIVRGKDRGKDAWHYILVDKEKRTEFLQVANSGGSLDLTNYGEILYSGWGKDPPEDIKKKVDEEIS